MFVILFNVPAKPHFILLV